MTSPADTSPVIEINGVSFTYNGQPVLERVDLTVREREFVWVVGPNGGGKTTLLRLVAGLLRPTAGRISVFGRAPGEISGRIGFVPQHATLDPRFPVTVAEVTLMGRLRPGWRPGPYSQADHVAAGKALEQLGLGDLRQRTPGELSGGQRQRLLIARALASEPDLLLLDEPTANLDRRVERELYDVLRALNRHLTIVMVSHDPAFVSDFVEQVVCVNTTVAVHPTTQGSLEFIDELYGTPMRLVRHDRHDAGSSSE